MAEGGLPQPLRSRQRPRDRGQSRGGTGLLLRLPRGTGDRWGGTDGEVVLLRLSALSLRHRCDEEGGRRVQDLVSVAPGDVGSANLQVVKASFDRVSIRIPLELERSSLHLPLERVKVHILRVEE